MCIVQSLLLIKYYKKPIDQETINNFWGERPEIYYSKDGETTSPPKFGSRSLNCSANKQKESQEYEEATKVFFGIHDKTKGKLTSEFSKSSNRIWRI